MAITAELRRVMEARETFAFEDAAAVMGRILAGEASEVELGALLGAMAARGETAAELAGFALALRKTAISLPLSQAEREQLVDTCGTGGDASGTFNISTAAALVAAAAGARVAKHGNRAITSRSGSADVLEALGVPIHLEPAAAADTLREHGFCFLLAPAHHPALRAVMPVRRALGVRTLLHVLGPLLNPAGARRQVMGVYAARLVPVVAQAMILLRVRHGFVVHGAGGPGGGLNGGLDGVPDGGLNSNLDELSVSGPSTVAEVRCDELGQTLAESSLSPQGLGLPLAPMTALAGGNANENAGILRTIFAGERGDVRAEARRNVVVLNAAAVLIAAGLANDMASGISRAQTAIDSGAVVTLVERLSRSSRRSHH